MSLNPSNSEVPSFDEQFAAWRSRWLTSLAEQIYDLHHRREVHDGFMSMLEASPNPDSDIFGDLFHRMYVEAQTMAIRRQADDNPRTLSLRRLIGQLVQHRRRFTREWYVQRWTSGMDVESEDERARLEAQFHHRRANEAFDQFTDKPGDQVLGGRRLDQDLQALAALTEKVVQYVNDNIAHVSAAPAADPVTYGEFHAAIDHLGEMLRRYYLLIDQGGLMSATPVIQGDWKGPFRAALA